MQLESSKFGPRPIPVSVRAWRRVDVRSHAECWYWTASTMAGGYGQIGGDHTMLYAHRVIYESIYGPIPDGFDIDHTCHNRAVLAGTCSPRRREPCPHKRCCNPSHLRAVRHRTNVAAGAAPTALLHRDGVCSNGHELTPDNTYVIHTSGREGTVKRCRACRMATQRRYHARQRAAGIAQA